MKRYTDDETDASSDLAPLETEPDWTLEEGASVDVQVK